MKLAQVKFNQWDKHYDFALNDLDPKVGDRVIVRTEMGVELGRVAGFTEADDDSVRIVEEQLESAQGQQSNADDSREDARRIKPILRIATRGDLEKIPDKEDKKKALDFVRQAKDKLGLSMKFIDVHYAFDGSRITFAFIADGRVDFRELVKELTRHFGRTIRLQQIGIRDEAKVMGDFGHCGRQLCCRKHLVELASITSEMAELQQCSHRGSDRISGVCGRLMCCLAYEECGYEHMCKKMPPIGARVNVDGKRGVVVGHNFLKNSVNVEFDGKKDDKTVMEVDLDRNKKGE